MKHKKLSRKQLRAMFAKLNSGQSSGGNIMTNYVVVRKRGNTIITTSPMPKSEAQRIAKDSRRPFMNYGSVRIRKAKSWEI